MPTSLLDEIPVELLARIAKYVGRSHRPSLLALALASKRCHSVAKRLFFHTIEFPIPVDEPHQVERDVGECVRILERNASFADVRILLIKTYDESRSWSFGLPLTVSEIVDGDKDRLQGLERRSDLVPKQLSNMSK
jgi:hypothetical protein